MAQAFALVVGRPYRSDPPADLALCMAAWALAKNAEFPRRLELIQDPGGVPVYAFAFKDMYIHKPHRSECTRFEVDPMQCYGLRPNEVTALHQANALLIAERAEATENRKTPAVQSSAPARQDVTTIADVRRLYPDLTEWHTGGGCFALRLDCEGGGYILITECEDAQLPSEDAVAVDVGRYAKNGEDIEVAEGIPIPALPEWIEGALDRASHPKNVADYFAKRLGASHPDDSLRDLPIDSPCGQECVNCIDAAAALIGHMRAAWGDDYLTQLPPALRLSHMAARIVEVYWRG
jgi:hypothetical protein